MRENWSYVLLAEELRRISTQPKNDAPELFRRMCFNALIIDTMEQTVKDRWYDIARREGVSEKDCETIRGAVAYEGFRLPIEEARVS